MTIDVQPRPCGFGAAITGLDLARPLSERQVADIRRAWLAHQVVWFPDQPMSHEDLERFTRYFGDWGNDPYVAPIDGHPHILEVRREPDEPAAPFGGAWHSDWSFQKAPPSATILHAKIVPPVGGDTWYADGYAAYEALSAAEKAELEGLTALHSARRPYSHEGYKATRGDDRTMKILPSDDAYAVQEHPLIRTHPETGRKVLWVNAVYTIGIKGMADEEAAALLKRLCDHATDARFVYKHQWAENMLTMWDNRSVQHCAQGGYDGHRRVMHRTTVAGERVY
ncbi:MAG: TauD/TfdA dioxygenase family protein [Pseudomonadota bacterium]